MDDFDGDHIPNAEDNCPENKELSNVDFRKFQSINLDPKGETQIDPVWRIRNEVQREIHIIVKQLNSVLN